MRIIDLTPEREFDYLSCLRASKDEPPQAHEQKREWFARYRDRGLVVKLAEDEDRNIVGMIHSLPIEETWIHGSDLDIIMCVRAPGPKSRFGGAPRPHTAGLLLQAMEASARDRGRRGLAAWGIGVPAWMKRNWFPAHGYRVVDRHGDSELLFKPFDKDVRPPRWLPRQHLREPGHGPDVGGCFTNGWCPAAAITHDRIQRCPVAPARRSARGQQVGAARRPQFVPAPYLRRVGKPQR